MFHVDVSVPLSVASNLAAAATGGSAGIGDPFTYLTGLGFPGVIIALLISGQLVPKGTVERMVADLLRKDQIIELKDQQISALQAGLVDKAIPAITRSTQVLESLPRTLQTQDKEVLEQLDNARREIDSLAARLKDLTRGDPT